MVFCCTTAQRVCGESIRPVTHAHRLASLCAHVYTVHSFIVRILSPGVVCAVSEVKEKPPSDSLGRSMEGFCTSRARYSTLIGRSLTVRVECREALLLSNFDRPSTAPQEESPQTQHERADPHKP